MLQQILNNVVFRDFISAIRVSHFQKMIVCHYNEDSGASTTVTGVVTRVTRASGLTVMTHEVCLYLTPVDGPLGCYRRGVNFVLYCKTLEKNAPST